MRVDVDSLASLQNCNNQKIECGHAVLARLHRIDLEMIPVSQKFVQALGHRRKTLHSAPKCSAAQSTQGACLTLRHACKG